MVRQVSKDGDLMRVDPDFKKMVKIESALKGKTMIDITREMAANRKSLIREEEEVQVEDRKPKFTWRI